KPPLTGRCPLHSHRSTTAQVKTRSTAGVLDEEALTGLEPVRNWEWLRLVVALLACTGAAVGASFLPIPDAGLPYAIAGAAAAAFMLAYTDQPAKALELWNRIGRTGG
ncbi:hypothetical protein, partial [Streptomyces sp. CoT10]|uniref:hypothetical protein n=1 Tax=Streptomyces sp. CoT10 TaxID=2875762 RepID=UPI001CD71345